MSETKFTAGAWKSTISNNGRNQICGDNGKQVCAMWNCKERDANSALIAAAPEMYALLEQICNGIFDAESAQKLLAKA